MAKVLANSRFPARFDDQSELRVGDARAGVTTTTVRAEEYPPGPMLLILVGEWTDLWLAGIQEFKAALVWAILLAVKSGGLVRTCGQPPFRKRCD